MNWGYKIFIVYGLFVAGITLMVFKSSNQKMDLVTTDYYANELKYQDKIDEAKRTAGLSEEVRYKINENDIVLNFPKDFAGKEITGTVALYCPSDEDKDLTKTFSVIDSAVKFPISTINKGQNELHINWQVNGLSYYMEKKIFIQ